MTTSIDSAPPSGGDRGQAASLVATAPGKLMLAGEYGVLAGGAAILIAVSRRVTARVLPRESRVSGSPFLMAVVDAVAAQFGADDASAEAARAMVVESASFLAASGVKLGLGSSAAVTVAAVARAIAARTSERDAVQLIDRDVIYAIARTAHAAAQSTLGAAGSGADIAACTFGGAIRFQDGTAVARSVPPSITLIPCFTGAAASTARLVAAVTRQRDALDPAIMAAIRALAEAAEAVDRTFVGAGSAAAVVAAFEQAGTAMDQLDRAAGGGLVPARVHAACDALRGLGGTVKTTGAGGGDTAIAVIPATIDVTEAHRLLIQHECQPLDLIVDETGVDLRAWAQ